MKLTFLGALVGAAMLTLAAPAGAATVTGTSIINSGGSASAGDPTFNFGATDLTNGVQGINGASFASGKRYYDYVFSFTLNTAADITAAASATAGTNILESHAALLSGSPSGTTLEVGHNPDPLTGLSDTSGL